jgi:hypothetical protein
MKNFQDLLLLHETRTASIIDKYISKYESLEEPKTLYVWNLFLMDNAKDVISDLSQSSIDVFHDAIEDGVPLNRDDFNSIRGVNLAAAARYKEELRKLYETIVRNDKSKNFVS